MPVTYRNQIIAKGGLVLGADGIVNRDLNIPYQDFFVAASPVMAGSVAINSIGGTAASLQALRFTSTSSTCPVTLVVPIPQDTALSSGSGTVYVHWTDMTTATAVAVIGASLFQVTAGSAIDDTSTCTLGAAASGTTITGTSASELNSSSLFQFAAPKTRNGFLALKFIYNSKDAGNTSGSNFNLFSVSLRYKSDRIGS